MMSGLTRMILPISGVVRDSSRPRAVPLVTAVAFHGLVLLFLLGSVTQASRPVPSALTVFTLSNVTATQASVPKAAKPEVVLPQVEPMAAPAPRVPTPVIASPAAPDVVAALLTQADASAADGACDLTAPVEAALRANIAVRDELALLPRNERSVANALMVWDAAWLSPEADEAADPLRVTRTVVAETVSRASEACRLQPQAGPRLIMMPGMTETLVLALGSGTWRWQDVLETAQQLEQFAAAQPAKSEQMLARLQPASELDP